MGSGVFFACCEVADFLGEAGLEVDLLSGFVEEEDVLEGQGIGVVGGE